MIGSLIILKKELKISSMDWAKSLINDVPDGTVFISKKYHKARGSNNRIWSISEGQLVLTFVLKPNVDINQSTMELLNIACSTAVVTALGKYDIGIKKPNDFYSKKQMKKVGGILFEPVWKDGELIGIVCGFAINCNNKFDRSNELYNIAISIKEITGRIIDIKSLKDEIVYYLNDFYSRWLNGRFGDISSAWNKHIFL